MIEKKCCTCRVVKPIEDFHSNNSTEDGYAYCCRDCVKLQGATYHSRVKDDPDYKKGRKEYRDSIHGRYSEYKKAARERGFVFPLSKEDCLTFWNKNCCYCGDLITGLGMDRVDSSRGYELDNLVPCCMVCNRMKLNYTTENFLFHIKKILHHMNPIQELVL